MLRPCLLLRLPPLLLLLLLLAVLSTSAHASSVSAVSRYEQPLTSKDRLVELRAGDAGSGTEHDCLVAVERIRSAGGDDRRLGSDGPDILSAGYRGRDPLDGRGGDDALFGGIRTRLLRGGPGDDVLHNGARQLEAGPGDDRLWNPTGDVRCGPGADEIRSLSYWRRTLTARGPGQTIDLIPPRGGLPRAARVEERTTHAARAASAHASSVSAISEKWYPETSKDRMVDDTTVSWRAAPGAANRLEVTVEPPRTVVLRDAAGAIEAGPLCVPRPDGSAACTGQNANLFLSLDAGDGDDELRVAGGGFARLSAHGGYGHDAISIAGGDDATVYGGPGRDVLTGGDGRDSLTGGTDDDRLVGGEGRDLLNGGLGDDRVDGGAGIDRALYERREDMRVDLRAGVGGHGAERDRIVAVERITSARGNDRILGSDGPDVLSGGWRGRDLLDGRGGDDVIYGNGGTTRVVRGGAGDDRIVNGSGRIDAGPGDDDLYAPGGEIRCGPGRDRVTDPWEKPPYVRTVVHGDCEWIQPYDFSISRMRAGRRALRLFVRPSADAYGRSCGVLVALESGGRRLARRHLRGAVANRATAVTLRTAGALPRRVTVALVGAVCDAVGSPRPGRLERVRRVTVEPLRGVVPVG